MANETAHCRILVTGGSGQVGQALRRTLAPLGEVIAPSSAELNLSDAGSIRDAIRQVRPRWVVNAGAYTAVDKAESEPVAAMAINGTAPQVIAEEAKKIGAALIHFSTDYVFDGTSTLPYVETDLTGPINEYGRTKLAGEQALLASGAACLIFRTSWVYGPSGNNFVKSILRLAREREHLRIVADQRGGPTSSYDLASMTANIIGHIEDIAVRDKCPPVEAVQPLAGIYHSTGSGITTWYEFAVEAISDLQRLDPHIRLATVEAISTEQYPTPARRPSNSALDCGKLERIFGWRMPHWRQSLASVVNEVSRQS